ncbi:unnamed protein product [Calypogeia fissa]
MAIITWACMCLLQVLKDSDWIDTSDEEDLEDLDEEDAELQGEKTSMKSPCTKFGNDHDSQFAADSEASEDGTEQMEHNSPTPHECSQDLEHSRTPNTPNTASKTPLVTTLDDLTPTQVLFGHGSYGGITLSQPPSCPSAHVASPSANANSQKASSGQAKDDSDIEAVMGLCNLSQSPTFQLPTSPKVLQHQHVVVGGFAGSVYSPTIPDCILGSQDVPDVFNNGTPFMDSRMLKEGEQLNDKGSEDEDETCVFATRISEHLGELGTQCALAMEKLDSIMEVVEKLH